MRWSEFVKHYLAHCHRAKRPKTVRNFDMPALNSFTAALSGDPDLSEITQLHIGSWHGSLEIRYGPQSVAIMWRSLRAAFGWAGTTHLIKQSPFAGLTVPGDSEPGRYLTAEEITLILREAPEPLRTAAVFALNTGMRIGEIMGLRWKQVRDGAVYLETTNRKSKRKAQIPLNSQALAIMGPRLSDDGLVFPFSARTIQEQLLKLAKRLNLGRVRFHDFRHTFTTNFLKRGSDGDLEAMGIMSRATARTYHHPPASHLAKHMQAIIEVPAKEEPPSTVPGHWGASSSTLAALRNPKTICARGDSNPQTLSGIRTSSVSVLCWDGQIED